MPKTLRDVKIEILAHDSPERERRRGTAQSEEKLAFGERCLVATIRMNVLGAHIVTALCKEKAVVGVPPLKSIGVVLCDVPRPDPYRPEDSRGWAEFDVPAPGGRLGFLDTPVEREALGRVHLEAAEAALSALRTLDGFPVAVFEQACRRFEKDAFRIWLNAGSKTVPGTRLKGTVAVEVDPAQTTRWLRLSHRGKDLATIALGRRDIPDFTASRFFNGVTLDGTVVTVGGNPYHSFLPDRVPPIWPPETVDLRDHPDVLALAREKGWIAP